MKKIILLSAALAFALSSCSYLGLVMKKIRGAEETSTCVVMGNVTSPGGFKAPLLIMAFLNESGLDSAGIKTADSIWISEPGPYILYLPEGRYSVAAFADFNENLSFENSELAGFYNEGGAFDAVPGQVQSGYDFSISDKAQIIFPAFRFESVKYEKQAELNIENSRTITLADERFSPKYSNMGLWSPDLFIAKSGINIYAPEKYNPSKIPVLFIHGAGGTPRDFKFLTDRMDREKFQPWFFHYPSGLRIEKLSGVLLEKILSIQNMLQFNTLYICAHSMGGLVARSMLNSYAADRSRSFIKLYVSISTPYGGNDIAGIGVDYTPVHVPSWKDVATDSAFLGSLYNTALSDSVLFYLFFGFAGNSRMFSESNDGAITLKSQLDPRARQEAVSIQGFDEDHVSILQSADVSAKFNEIMKSAFEFPGTAAFPDDVRVLMEPATAIKMPLLENPDTTAWIETPGIQDSRIKKYYSMLTSGDPKSIISAAKTISRDSPFVLELTDTASIILLTESADDKHHPDALSWMCNLLGSSGEISYISTLKTVAEKSGNSKVAKFAEKNITSLEKIKIYTPEQFAKWKAGSPESGSGHILYPDGTSYSGQTAGGRRHGRGSLHIPGKAGYTGDWVDGRISGSGIISYHSGVEYEGSMLNGLRHGAGTMNFPDGFRFSGRFLKDKRNGEALVSFPSGGDYSCEWRDDVLVSQLKTIHGAKTISGTVSSFSFNPALYSGTWKDIAKNSGGECLSGNCADGVSVIKYRDGLLYRGGFSRGQRQGFGIAEHPDGHKYRGQWNRNLRHGHGLMIYPDGAEYSGPWENNSREGSGFMKFHGGVLFQSSYKKDLIEGEGIKTVPGEGVYTASYSQNRLISGETLTGSLSEPEENSLRSRIPDFGPYQNIFSDMLSQNSFNESFRIAKGISHFKKSSHDTAEKYFAQALLINPDSIEAGINIAALKATGGDWIKAISLCDSLLKKNPDSPEIFILRAWCWEKRRYEKRAIEDLTRAISIDPFNSQALSNRAALFIRAGDNEKALKDIELALSIQPENPLVLFNSGVASYLNGGKKTAARFFKKSNELEPSNPQYRKAWNTINR